MQNLYDSGVRVLRTWAFNSGQSWHGFEPTKGNYDEREFDLFDYVLYSARKVGGGGGGGQGGIKVVVTLDNYWADYGGITQRLSWVGAQPSPNQGVFFTNEAAIDSYLNYVQHFISRTNHYTSIPYVNDTTVFAWEVCGLENKSKNYFCVCMMCVKVKKKKKKKEEEEEGKMYLNRGRARGQHEIRRK